MKSYNVSKQIAYELVENEAVIVNVDTGDYFSLNPIASEILVSIDNGRPMPEIVERLKIFYPEEVDTIEQSVEKFLEELLSKNIIE